MDTENNNSAGDLENNTENNIQDNNENVQDNNENNVDTSGQDFMDLCILGNDRWWGSRNFCLAPKLT